MREKKLGFHKEWSPIDGIMIAGSLNKRFEERSNRLPLRLVLHKKPLNVNRESFSLPVLVKDEFGEIKNIAEISECIGISFEAEIQWWDYAFYVNSKEWRDRKDEYFQSHAKECAVCKSRNNIQLHHKSYRNLGFEPDSDLVPLCEKCHDNLHECIDKYIQRIGDRASIWTTNTKSIQGADCRNDLTNRYIAKYKEGLSFVFHDFPSINKLGGGGKAKFISIFRESLRDKTADINILPFTILSKLMK